MSKVIVITGAGGVLFSGLAKALAKAGHKIVILDLRIEAAKKVADEINAAGGKAIGVADRKSKLNFNRLICFEDRKDVK